MERIRAEIITEANIFIGDNPSTFETEKLMYIPKRIIITGLRFPHLP